jgi:ring-1,2-phenylacetyl-CoA epoxidase subunit PaaD
VTPAIDPDEQIARAWKAAKAVVEPDAGILTIAELGILRDIRIVDGFIEATITPTCACCPAMNLIALNLELALEQAGFYMPRIRIVLSPAWTTDWITDAGRAKLNARGMALPRCNRS